MSATTGLDSDYDKCFIECVGMPGAGKSHVASSLVQVLSDSGVPVQDDAVRIALSPRRRRIPRKVAFITRSIAPVLAHFSDSLGAGLRVWWQTPSRGLKVLFNWAYVMSLLRVQLRRKGVPVLDQGILQALWSVQFHFQEQVGRTIDLHHCLNDALEFLGNPRVIVLFVEADHSRLRGRLRRRTRGGSPLDKEDYATTKAWNAARSATARVLELSEWMSVQRALGHVIRIDNSREDPSGSTLEAELAQRVVPLLTDFGD